MSPIVTPSPDSSGGGSLSTLGPFTLAYNDPGAGTTVKLADLAAGTLVLGVYVFLTTAWADAGNLVHQLIVGVGGPAWADPVQDWWPIYQQNLDVALLGDAGAGVGYGAEVAATTAASGVALSSAAAGGLIGAQSGALIAFVTDAAPPTQGQATIYALVS